MKTAKVNVRVKSYKDALIAIEEKMNAILDDYEQTKVENIELKAILNAAFALEDDDLKYQFTPMTMDIYSVMMKKYIK